MTFNSALRPILSVLSSTDQHDVFNITNSFLLAIQASLRNIDSEDALVNPIVFRAVFDIFKPVAQRVKDRYGRDYSVENFYSILQNVIEPISKSKFSKPGTSYKDLAARLSRNLTDDFFL